MLAIEALQAIAGSAVDVLPIMVFMWAFQRLVIRQRIQNLAQIAVGLLFVIVGLGLFLVGLEQSLFPLGRLMAEQLTHSSLPPAQHVGLMPDWHEFRWVYIFGAAVGFSTALAEPALIAVSMKASTVSGGVIKVWSLRVAVAVGVSIGVALGCYRIIAGLPLHYFIAACYVVVILQTMTAPRLIVPLAYDSGGVTTSTVTVPLVTALGLGLAETIPGRNPLQEGFGLVAMACLFPIMSVLAYGQLAGFMQRFR